MAKLHLAQIVFADENGNKYPVNVIECSVGSTFAVNISSSDPTVASQLMAGALIGGGLDAIQRLFAKPNEK